MIFVPLFGLPSMVGYYDDSTICVSAGALAPGVLSLADSSSKEGCREETALARAVWPQLSFRRQPSDVSDAYTGRNRMADHPKSSWILGGVSVKGCIGFS